MTAEPKHDDLVFWCVGCERYHRISDGHHVNGAMQWLVYLFMAVLLGACAGVAFA